MYNQEEQKQLFEISKKLLDSQDNQNAARMAGELRKVIQYHEWRYYILNDPVISDYEYDMLFKKLEALEAAHPELITLDSPTYRVSSDLVDNFTTVRHLTPMLSLANSYNRDDLLDFDKQIKKLNKLNPSEEIEYSVEPKYDGGSITLVFENDILARAATRGNGTEGEDITANIKTIKTIPLRASFSRFGIEVAELRGEAVIRKDAFEKINTKRELAGLQVFANPRNTATGGLRTKDPQETAQRGIEAFIYQISYFKSIDTTAQKIAKHHDQIEMLGHLGFKIPTIERKVCRNIEEVIKFCELWETKRDTYQYEIDGMVIKVNSLELQEKSGSTSHHPRWAIAYKFKAKQATTKLISVDFQVGKIGSITPVAKLEPVPLAGVTVSSVSLHNEDFIVKKDIRIGDVVLVERAGDVIPYIVKSMPELRDGSEQKIDFPRQCPVCSSELVRIDNEAAWRCMNYQCEAQVMQRIIHHVSKDAMDIEGFGKANVERFYAKGWLKNIKDVYRLDYEQIANLEGFGPKSAENLKKGIEKARSNPIKRFLYSLSIHHLGKRVASILAAEIPHVLDLQNWDLERFTTIKDIGPVVAQNIITFFDNPANIQLLHDMEELGVNLTQKEADQPLAVAVDAPFTGKTILFTGTLAKMGRKEAQQMAATAGARNISAVSSKLDILVVGSNAGSKLKKAQALGHVTIMTEDEFLQSINE